MFALTTEAMTSQVHHELHDELITKMETLLTFLKARQALWEDHSRLEFKPSPLDAEITKAMERISEASKAIDLALSSPVSPDGSL